MRLRAAISHFGFKTVHPFQDGNRRIACSNRLALAQEDKSSIRLYTQVGESLRAALYVRNPALNLIQARMNAVYKAQAKIAFSGLRLNFSSITLYTLQAVSD